MICRLPQAFTVVKDEGSVLIFLVGWTLWMILGVVEGEEVVRVAVGGRVEGFGLGVERAQVHGGDGGGDWGGERSGGGSFYITKLPGGDRGVKGNWTTR